MAYLLDSGLAIAFNNTPTTAVRASGGASGSTSVVISVANSNIAYNQRITGNGLAPNTTVTSVSGTTVNFTPAAIGQISGVLTFTTNWHKLTDHNRQPIEVSTTLIEKEQRMANGTMRKFVVNKKDTISTSWENVPTLSKEIVSFTITSATVSGNNIIYVTSSNHNFVSGSLVKIKGFSDDKLNITTSVISASTNSFQVGNIKNATNGVTNQTASVKQILISLTTVDENYGASWLTAFYNANAGTPIFIRLTASRHNDPAIGQIPNNTTYASSQNASKIYNVFITNFNRSISKRTRTTDYVDMNIEFTEI
jgi:hypothetical protein